MVSEDGASVHLRSITVSLCAMFNLNLLLLSLCFIVDNIDLDAQEKEVSIIVLVTSILQTGGDYRQCIGISIKFN